MRLVLSLIVSISLAILVGKKPYKFLANFIPTPRWIIDETYSISATQRTKAKNRRLKVDGKAQSFQALNNLVDFTILCRLQAGKEINNGYILSSSDGNLDDLEVHLVWKCQGFNFHQQSHQKSKEICDKLSALFKKLDCTTTVILASNADSDSLKSKHVSFSCKELELLAQSGWERKQNLVKSGECRDVSLYIHTIYKPSKKDTDKSLLDKGSDRIWAIIKSIFKIQQGGDGYTNRLAVALGGASTAGQRYNIALEEAGLEPVNLSIEELWTYLCSKNNKSVSDSTPPHILAINENQELKIELLQPFKKGDLHPINTLLGKYPPLSNRKDIYHPNFNKYFGVLVLEGKPLAYTSYTGMLQYLLPLYSQKFSAGIELEIITEITPVNSRIAAIALEKSTNNAISAQNQASVQNRVSVASGYRYEQSVEGREKIVRGDSTFRLSLTINVRGNTQAEVDDTCRILAASIPLKIKQEVQYAPLIWLQSRKLKRKPLLYSPFDRRLLFFGSEVVGLFPFTQTNKLDNSGFELIAQPDGRPVFFDLSEHGNILISAKTGGGKTVLALGLILQGIFLGLPVVIIDYPNADGSGSFSEFGSYLPNAVYYDISKGSYNLVEPPDLSSNKNLKNPEERFEIFLDSLINIITRIVLGSDSLEGFLVKRITDFIPVILRTFYDNAQIQQRFASGGDNVPTLADVIEFVSPKYVEVDDNDKDAFTALSIIKSSIKACLASPIGKAIGRPSTVDTKAQVFIIALTNLNNDWVAEIMILVALLICQRQTLAHQGSIFFLDEASVNLGFLSIAIAIATLCATGRKADCRVVLAAQEFKSVIESAKGNQVEANLSIRFIGRIELSSTQQYTDYLDIPPHIISQNQYFRTNKIQAYSNWLVDYNQTYVQCRYYPSFILLALAVNGAKEKKLREEFKKKYPDTWVQKFANYLENRTVV